MRRVYDGGVRCVEWGKGLGRVPCQHGRDQSVAACVAPRAALRRRRALLLINRRDGDGGAHLRQFLSQGSARRRRGGEAEHGETEAVRRVRLAEVIGVDV